jgi:2,4-dienoyl-CoA reductase-like NADH-dependent reductase (Old Yellow Enzyme family)
LAEHDSSTPARSRLFSPLVVNQLVLPNRIVVTAMVTRLSGEDGHVNQDVVDRYVRFAKGEAGLVVVEATAVHASKSGPLLRLNSDDYIPGHRRLLAEMRAAGPSKVALQIIHFLKIARSGWRQTVDMLTSVDLSGIVEAYGEAAFRARAAGYDAVELHMAHAYTLSSFLSARNRRLDRYGGRSLESRLRLPGEVLLRVRERVGHDFTVGVRFDGEECIKGGYGLNDAQFIAMRLAQLGADYISISAGGKFEDAVHREGQVPYPYTGYSGDRTMPPASYPDGANLYLAEGIKQFLNANGRRAPVVATGKISSPRMAEGVLQKGQADLIGLARPLLADPDWPRKARLGRDDTIVRCVYGNVCKNLDENFRQVRCGSLWPRQFLHAPEAPNDQAAPVWPEVGATTAAQLNAESGQVRLTWTAAYDPQGIYGYEVFRAVNDGPFVHLTSSLTTSHVDLHALAGNKYRYCVRAYDFAGNRSAPSGIAELEIQPKYTAAQGRALNLGGQFENQKGELL